MRHRRAGTGLLLCLSLCGCTLFSPRPSAPPTLLATPVRFLLTFDDGPSTREPFNPTRAVAEALAANPVQPGIKAIFFVQTRDKRAGDSVAGRAMMNRLVREGHVLGVHSGSPRGHVSHVRLRGHLDGTLSDARADIRAVAGTDPQLVRPPFWTYNNTALASYRRHSLHMLLTDINARDGKIYGFHASPRRRIHFRSRMRDVRAAIEANRLPSLNGTVPIVITFHDINLFTARHMREYLGIVMDSAAAAGLNVAQPAFFADRTELGQAALLRARAAVYATNPP